MMRIELMTSSLPRKRSTPELHRQHFLSGRRGSNPRPLAWKANALSTELLPQFVQADKVNDYKQEFLIPTPKINVKNRSFLCLINNSV